MSIPQNKSAYRIYLLTVWLDDANDQANPEMWRFRLEEPRRGRSRGFVGVTALLAGLVRVIGGEAETEEGKP